MLRVPIPTLVLLDEIGNLITTDARNKSCIGFPWKSPISVLISTVEVYANI